MTNNHDSRRARLTEDPALHPAVFAAAFNSGDSKAVDRAYEENGIVVPSPGHPMTGPGRIAAIEHLLGLGAPIEARTRHSYVADDIALLIVDWSIRGTARDGTDVHFEGAAADVARRGPDGLWRYVIDNPYGTA
ncbi:hypothetical protein GCM10010156_63940 [Planobispora rosea]|uniref:DUF4440 domain-containing protein n=1 Tax=Planobispora rosea TaxID=35762 RepID=A0A8J3WHD4_PLARO|nr:nuclear transport factor 2 family protein [Planobispora rosea]GGS96974.1 hypothetical protein GCM10010156_63940 [Planobispora rosea]GIH87736.1 hypothetical protein Pro02_61440 [Planobispora rosea]